MLPALVRSAGLYGLAVAAVTVRRAVSRLGLYVVIAFLGVVGLGFVTAAAFLALAQAMGAIYAALFVGCAYLVGALLVLVVAQTRRAGW
ncbi:MAG TPA: hypothetical protein VJ890_06825 [Vineibacter sp.]|nr:hypothetical protein [Vineibacter sp.]